MAKAISFINQTPESSEHDYFLELLKRLGDPLNKISNEKIKSLTIEQKNIILSTNMIEYSSEFIQFLFNNTITHLITWEAFNPTGMPITKADTSYKDLFDLIECYEEETFDNEFNELLFELINEFFRKNN
jgi:hypothetical protein